MKRKLLFCLLACLFGGGAVLMAQVRTVKGTVTDESGAPVIAAGVQEKGTNKGAITDLDGNYAITVSDGAIVFFHRLC